MPPTLESGPAPARWRRHLGSWVAAALCLSGAAGAWWMHVNYPAEPRVAHEKTNFERAQDLRILSVLMLPMHVLTSGKTLPAAAEVARCQSELIMAGDKAPTPECARTDVPAKP